MMKVYEDLKDKKKLKFIKQAESKFDEVFGKSTPENNLSKYFTKDEVEILLKSYGLPEHLPKYAKQNKKLIQGTSFSKIFYFKSTLTVHSEVTSFICKRKTEIKRF